MPLPPDSPQGETTAPAPQDPRLKHTPYWRITGDEIRKRGLDPSAFDTLMQIIAEGASKKLAELELIKRLLDRDPAMSAEELIQAAKLLEAEMRVNPQMFESEPRMTESEG